MREVIGMVLKGQSPPYIPWSCGFTEEARMKLQHHFGTESLEQFLDNHLLKLGSDIGFFEEIGEGRVRDVFGVVWDRTVDKDIGIVEGCLLPEATLAGFGFPDPLDKRYFADIPEKLALYGDRFRVFHIGFSLYERAWTLRGMENLLVDFLEHPAFVDELLNSIADYNIAMVREAMKFDIDAVYFGDDWGQQQGLLMGPRLWRRFILPVLRRMFCTVRMEGKYVMIHSCGDVDELFDDLTEAGVSCFNPFQPEVMDVYRLLPRYRGRLAFHGGMSTQRTLPFGSVEDVRAETRRLLGLGSQGGYIFAPAHDVEGDVPLENILAFLEILQRQPGYQERQPLTIADTDTDTDKVSPRTQDTGDGPK
jgi:uroporphyrinogen decarboxylase